MVAPGCLCQPTPVHEGSKRAIIAALLANFGIAVLKFLGWIVTQSASLLAECVHSMADTGNQALLLFGGRRAARRATPAHPFGYGRERYFWAFVVALVLFALGSLFALIEGIEKLRHPHELESPIWAIGVLSAAIVMEAFSLRTAVREANHVRGHRSWVGFIRHSKSAELPVVLLEDTGALLGLVFALGGVGLAMATGNARFDAVGSLAIALLLGAIAVVLAIEMKSLLIGEGASPAQLDAIRRAIEDGGPVRRLIHLRTLHLAPDELLVAGKVELDQGLSFPEVTAAVDEAEARIRQSVPEAELIYLEPDRFDPDRFDPAGQAGAPEAAGDAG